MTGQDSQAGGSKKQMGSGWTGERPGGGHSAMQQKQLVEDLGPQISQDPGHPAANPTCSLGEEKGKGGEAQRASCMNAAKSGVPGNESPRT